VGRGRPAPKHIAEQQRVFWAILKARTAMAQATTSGPDHVLIEKAIREGRVTICPPATAQGALRWGCYTACVAEF